MRALTYGAIPIMFSLSIFGCSDANQTSTKEQVSAEGNVTQQQTQEPTEQEEVFVSQLSDDAPVVRVATEANYAPFEFKDSYGNVTGFDLELIRAIGEEQGFKVEILNDPWEDLFVNLESGKRDLIVAGTTHSDEREQKYLLSDPYAPLPNSITYLDKNITINNLGDIKGLKLGVLDSSAPYRFFSGGDYGLAELKQYPTTYLAVQDLVQGNIDAVASDAGVIRYTMRDIDGIEPKYFDYEKLTDSGSRKVMISQKNNTQLISQINEGLKKLKQDGTYSKLTTKWFGKDLTEESEKQDKMLKSLQN